VDACHVDPRHLDRRRRGHDRPLGAGDVDLRRVCERGRRRGRHPLDLEPQHLVPQHLVERRMVTSDERATWGGK